MSFKTVTTQQEQSTQGLGGTKTRPELPKGTETILLVEDEEGVREFALRILSRLGYKVLHAPGGKDALTLIEKTSERIDILMTDVLMPGMNGRELAELITTQHPEMKVLFTSGYTEDVFLGDGVSSGQPNFLAKPYSIHALAKKIRDVLETPSE
jgi:CheY-like chemotaxis protein